MPKVDVLHWLVWMRHWFPFIAAGTSILCFFPFVNLLIFPRYVCGAITAVLLYMLFMGNAHNIYVFGGLMVLGVIVIPKVVGMFSITGFKTYVAALINLVLVAIIWIMPFIKTLLK